MLTPLESVSCPIPLPWALELHQQQHTHEGSLGAVEEVEIWVLILHFWLGVASETGLFYSWEVGTGP